MSAAIDVSVIVPVYNSGKYLIQCVESIISQTLENMEVIFIDDGSVDDSVKILEKYASCDKRIRILFQDHKNAGTARNLGKSVAKGKYLVFWDSDDYFYPTALKDMFFQCEKDEADICICGGRQFWENQNFESPGLRYLRKSEIPSTIPFNVRTAPDHIVSITVEAPWNKMFRREYIEKNGIDFKQIRNANDVFFVITALCMAEKITIVDKPLICYRKDKGTGLVSSVSKGLMTALQTWLDTADYLRAYDVFPERSFANRCLESIVYLLNNTLDWETYKEAFLFLQDGNLERLAIKKSDDEEYYYIKYMNEVSRHLYDDTPEEYCKWIGYVLYLREGAAVGQRRHDNEKNREKITSLNKKIASREKRIKDLEESCSYRVGKKLMWLPGKVKRFLKK